MARKANSTVISLTPIPAQYIQLAKTWAAKLIAEYPCPAGTVDREYLHWSVAPHGDEFPDYNLMVLLVNGAYEIAVTHDPRDNADGVNNNAPASHTWHRNTGAIGISIDGMDGATVDNFGPDALDAHTLWTLCAAGAAVCIAYGLDANGKVTKNRPHADNNGATVNTTGETVIATHAEAAVWDSYESERWDLGCFEAQSTPLTVAERMAHGDILRSVIHDIKLG